MTEIDLTPGNLVHYTPKHGPKQNGVIKSENEFDPTVVFVVYNCAGEWDDYKNYTGVSTKISDLKIGWHDE